MVCKQLTSGAGPLPTNDHRILQMIKMLCLLSSIYLSRSFLLPDPPRQADVRRGYAGVPA